MSRINAIMLLASFLVTFAAVAALPVAINAIGAGDVANAVAHLDERKLIITSCGILGNSCAFAVTDDEKADLATVSNTEEDSAATKGGKVDAEVGSANANRGATPGEEAITALDKSAELAIRDPKLIITSCGILGNSCAFVIPAEADGDTEVGTTEQIQAASIKTVNEDPAVEEAANHIIERMDEDMLTVHDRVDKAKAALPNAYMLINAVIG